MVVVKTVTRLKRASGCLCCRDAGGRLSPNRPRTQERKAGSDDWMAGHLMYILHQLQRSGMMMDTGTEISVSTYRELEGGLRRRMSVGSPCSIKSRSPWVGQGPIHLEDLGSRIAGAKRLQEEGASIMQGQSNIK